MKSIIDWLSFTVNIDSHDDVPITRLFVPALNEIKNVVTCWHKLNDLYFSRYVWEQTSARAPYQVAWRCGSVTMYAGKNVPTILMEISGVGCAELQQCGLLMPLVNDVRDHVSRIDIAYDAETNESPVMLSDKYCDGGTKLNRRFKSRGHIESQTGTTCYVGSMSSDRYLRIYRYNPPHPRSNTARYEFVLRRKYAKKVAAILPVSGVGAVAKTLGNIFRVTHWSFNPDGESIPDDLLTIPRTNIQDRDSLRWVIKQCLPTIVRLINEGVTTRESIIALIDDGLF